MKEWKDKPVKIAWGVPINPSYLDGTYTHTNNHTATKVKDRDGKTMNYSDIARLNRYRVEARDKWRLENADTIKNLKEGGDK